MKLVAGQLGWRLSSSKEIDGKIQNGYLARVMFASISDIRSVVILKLPKG